MGLIELSLRDGCWHARFVGDTDVVRLFGTDTLPTAYTAQASAEQVLAAITRQNLGKTVRMGQS